MNELYFLESDCAFRSIDYEKLRSVVSCYKKLELKNKYCEIDMKLSLLAKFILRIIVFRKFKIDFPEMDFQKNIMGKPMLTQIPNFYFNISHTHFAIAISVSDRETGVDIERIRTYNCEIMDRFFSKAEKKQVINGDKEAFWHIWTKKEAYAKKNGTGINKHILECDSEILEQKIFYSVKAHNYIITVCNTATNDELNIIELNEYIIAQKISNVLDFENHLLSV